MTGEAEKEIAFTGIRWRKAVAVKSGGVSEDTDPIMADTYAKVSTSAGVNLADGFDSPVGIETAGELGSDGLWLDAAKEPLRSEWYMSTDYNQRYKDSSGDAAIHTGVDLNLNPKGQWNKDKGQPVYAIASGIVTFADMVKRYWGNIVVIQHDPMEEGGAFVMSRAGHLAQVFVKAGQRVKRGERIGTVGSNLDVNGKSVGNEHLHFDISPTQVLVAKPTDWPGLDQRRVTQDYVDPKAFIRDHRPKK
jgi:murein DD-endopeptidase MepM/ murein hydrolase activator NlpD